MIRAIASDNFPPFGKFEAHFPPVENRPDDLGEVHLLTGVNGSGKTRLLLFMAALLGSSERLAQRVTPGKSQFQLFATDAENASDIKEDWAKFAFDFGQLSITPNSKSGQFYSRYNQMPAFAYSGIAYVRDVQGGADKASQQSPRDESLSFSRPETHSYVFLQNLSDLIVAAALQKEGSNTAQNRMPKALLLAIENTVGGITGQTFKFDLDWLGDRAVKVKWGGKILPFAALPDGLRSIIGWVVHAGVMVDRWLQGKTDPREAEAIFLIDEPETHLHPAWQRKIIPAFQRLFPKSQIFVATHSPFVISSITHGWIHPITLDENGSAKFEIPIAAQSGENYVSVVKEIMGVKEWFDPETEQMLEQFRNAREKAYHGDEAARQEAGRIAASIGGRSVELDYIMHQETGQIDRQLANKVAAK